MFIGNAQFPKPFSLPFELNTENNPSSQSGRSQVLETNSSHRPLTKAVLLWCNFVFQFSYLHSVSHITRKEKLQQSRSLLSAAEVANGICSGVMACATCSAAWWETVLLLDSCALWDIFFMANISLDSTSPKENCDCVCWQTILHNTKKNKKLSEVFLHFFL